MLARMWRKRNSPTLLVEMQNGAATVENSMEVPQKVKIELPYNPTMALFGTYPKDTKMLTQRDTSTLMFIATLSTIAKLWKPLKCPSADKEEVSIKIPKEYWCVCIHMYTHNRIFSHKKE